MPDEIEKLKNLRILFLNGNKLKTIPKSILKLKKLAVLYLDDNYFSEKYKKSISGNIKSTNLRSALETINAIDLILENS